LEAIEVKKKERVKIIIFAVVGVTVFYAAAASLASIYGWW
jgi:hypothetical protein